MITNGFVCICISSILRNIQPVKGTQNHLPSKSLMECWTLFLMFANSIGYSNMITKRHFILPPESVAVKKEFVEGLTPAFFLHFFQKHRWLCEIHTKISVSLLLACYLQNHRNNGI